MNHWLKATDLQLRVLDYKQMASFREKNTKPEAQTEIFESYHVTDVKFDRQGLSATTCFTFPTQYLSRRSRTQNLKANKLSMSPHLKDRGPQCSQIFILNKKVFQLHK